jgi:hypothetical protein
MSRLGLGIDIVLRIFSALNEKKLHVLSLSHKILTKNEFNSKPIFELNLKKLINQDLFNI